MRKVLLLLALSSLLSLSSCQSFIKLDKTNYVKTSSFEEIKKDEEGEGYYRIKEYQSLSYGNDGKTINSLRDIYSSGVSHYNAPATGKIYALVIPVNFLDSDTFDNKKQETIIHNAFFGIKERTRFESLSSFYDYSSYGQLEFTGMVTKHYTYPYQSTELGNGTSSISSRVAGSALKWFYDNYPDVDKEQFDSDHDDNIDALFIIYNHQKSDSPNSLWWAYCDHMSRSIGGNVNAPYGSSYAWISYDFLDGKNNYAETHVGIHESGHIFGLADYYNTNSGALYQPTGYVDMMDRNIGDHTGYSKMLLDWTTPYVANGDGKITLKPFSTSGDLLLIPTSKGWNKTPYDEYLLLEYYTPTGMNANDAGTKYSYLDKNNEKQIFTFLKEPGLKVYHVDSRVGYFDSMFSHNLLAIIGDDDELEKISGRSSYCLDFVYNNTISDSKAKTDPVLYHLLERSGENTLINGKPFESKSLFKKGDSFGIDTFKDFVFDNGSKLTYTFKIDEMNKDGITISFDEIK